MKYTLNSSSFAYENQDILPQTYSHKNIRKKERIRKIGFIRTWLREDILPFHVSQEDVRRGSADIKPLEFVPVSDGRKLRKEKRPPPPPAPIDFVRRLFRSDHWISNPMLLERRGRIFDHNSSTKRRNNSFFFLFIGNNQLVESREETILTCTRFSLFPAFLTKLNWERKRDASRFPRRKIIQFSVSFYFSRCSMMLDCSGRLDRNEEKIWNSS